MTGTPYSPKSGMKKLLWLANLFFALVLSLGLWASYDEQLKQANERAANTSLMLERTLSGVLDQIDMLLMAVQNELEDGLRAGKIDTQRVDALSHRLARNVPGLNVVRYSDASGLAAAGTGYPNGNPANDYQDRDYFQYLRDHPDAGTINSKPLIGRSSGRWGVVFSRAYRDPGGNFAGTALASIDLDRFSAMFAAMKLSERSRITFSDRDFSVLALQPMPPDPSWFGRRIPLENIIKQLETGIPLLTVQHNAITDGRPKSSAIRKLESRPYWIAVSIDMETELASWRQQAVLAFIVMLVFAVLTAAAGRQLQQGWRRQEASRAMLESTLEATGDGILVVSSDGKVQHSNRAFAQQWQIPEALLASGDDHAMLMHVQNQLRDPASFIRQVAALYADPSAESFDTLAFKNGRSFERTSRPMRLDGNASGRVWIFRDVSAKRRFDDLLHFIAERNWETKGETFLPAIARQIGEMLDVVCVSISKLGEPSGTHETLGLFLHGNVVPNITYALAGTPCEKVYGQTACVYRDKIQQSFPEDHWLSEIGAESYLGIPLWDAAGHPVGAIALINSKPLNNVDQTLSLLQLVGASAGAEIELIRHRNHLEELVEDRTHALHAALQLAEAANRAKSVFLSNMSHELRTPLNAVIGFSQLMTRSPGLGDTEKRNLEIINRSGNHLLALINDVLELSKIDAGGITLQEEPCDLAHLAGEVTDMLRTRAEQAGLSLTLSVEELPGTVRVDTTKLRQILINLLGNAIKFTPTGSVDLTLKGSPSENGAVRVTFAVRDTGIGIAPQDQQRIFEPFTQLVTHATSAGTGLGLTITKQYLQMLGSQLRVDSMPGQGATFSFELTLSIQDPALGPGAGPEQTKNATNPAAGRRILIAEDQDDSRLLLVSLLTPYGFMIEEAADGLEAVERAIRFHPELILMDWRMPKLDGLEATRQILQACHEQSRPAPKVVMLSANAFEEERQVALATGISTFLRKPLQENELNATLETHLGLQLVPAESAVESPSTADLSTAELATLPTALLAALCTAVEELNPVNIKTVLAQIEPDHPQLARNIGTMTEHFRYQALWQLLKDAHGDTTANRTAPSGKPS